MAYLYLTHILMCQWAHPMEVTQPWDEANRQWIENQEIHCVNLSLFHNTQTARMKQKMKITSHKSIPILHVLCQQSHIIPKVTNGRREISI